MNVKLWYNENCSKSRKALDILKENGIEVDIVNYLTDELNKQDLLNLILKLKNTSVDLVRLKESELTKSKLNKLSVSEIIDLIIEKPECLQRPIIQTKDFSFIARPATKIKQYLKLY